MSPTEQKVVLITGGSRGIGKALVEQFKRGNWRVAACATALPHLDQSQADYKFECDVSDAESVKVGVKSVMTKMGRIDALINNAGVVKNNPLEPDASDEIWHRIIDVNLHGTYYMMKQTAPHLPDGSGRIVNIASILALQGVADGTAYCAAKHGVVGLTRSFAQVLAPRRISVNSVCPGWVRTDMGVERLKEIGLTESDLQSGVPMGRYIEPEEVSDFVYYLIDSKRAIMITGQALSINGGAL